MGWREVGVGWQLLHPSPSLISIRLSQDRLSKQTEQQPVSDFAGRPCGSDMEGMLRSEQIISDFLPREGARAPNEQ